jgi:regulator of cell morphogenesis and NO signaling
MLDPTMTVARAVLDHSETAPVFQRHRIDYCCQGGRSIHAAAEARGVDLAALVAELELAIASRRGDAGPEPATMSTPALVDYIVVTHHAYLRDTLPFVTSLAAKVARVHGERDPRLREVDATVTTLATTLGPHLDDEERELFPALLAADADLGQIRGQLASMHAEHEVVGELLARLRDTTEDFRLPTWACTSYRALFAELAQLEGDILRHVHLENHVLMPRFVEA